MRVLYEPYTFTLAAGATYTLIGKYRFFILSTATNPAQVAAACGNRREGMGGHFSPLVQSLKVGPMEDIDVILIQNTDVSPNTITVIVGDSDIAFAGNNVQTTPGAPGQKTAANSQSVVLASDQGTIPVVGPVAAGSAIGATAPVMAAGSDGVNVQRIKVDTSGNQVAVGAVAAGSVIGATAPVMVGVSDGTNVQRLKGSATGAVFVAGEAAHSAASVGNPVRVGARVNTAVDTTLVAGDAADLFATSGGQLSVKPFGLPETDWQYAAGSAGIVATTSTLAKAAGAAGVRNYVTGVQITSSSTTAYRIDILDGVTVIHSIFVPANLPAAIALDFPTPLRGTAATAMNYQLSAAPTGGAAFVQLQGYQAA